MHTLSFLISNFSTILKAINNMTDMPICTFIYIYSSNPVGRPRKKGRKEKKMNVDFTNEHLSMLNDSQESSNTMGISDDSQVSISLHSHSTLPIGGSGTILPETPSQSVLAQEPTMPKRPHNVNISKQFIACLNMQNNSCLNDNRKIHNNISIYYRHTFTFAKTIDRTFKR